MSGFPQMFQECGSMAFASLALTAFGLLVAVSAVRTVLARRRALASGRPAPSAVKTLVLVAFANSFGFLIFMSGAYGEMRGRQMTERAASMASPDRRAALHDEGWREAKGCKTLATGLAAPVELVAIVALLFVSPSGPAKPEERKV